MYQILKSLIKKRLLLRVLKITYSNCLKWKYFKSVFSNFKLLLKVPDCIYGTFIDAVYYLSIDSLPAMTVKQLEFRHAVMNKECYDMGSCVVCGCTTTALQAAKPSCEGNCYPYWMDDETFAEVALTKAGNLSATKIKKFIKDRDRDVQTNVHSEQS